MWTRHAEISHFLQFHIVNLIMVKSRLFTTRQYVTEFRQLSLDCCWLLLSCFRHFTAPSWSDSSLYWYQYWYLHCLWKDQRNSIYNVFKNACECSTNCFLHAHHLLTACRWKSLKSMTALEVSYLHWTWRSESASLWTPPNASNRLQQSGFASPGCLPYNFSESNLGFCSEKNVALNNSI